MSTLLAPTDTFKHVGDNTYFDTKREPTILEVADAAKYDDFEIVYRFDKKEVHSEPAPEREGFIYRFSFWLKVVPYRQQFIITLKRGANAADLNFAEKMVEEIREGKFLQFPWHEIVSASVDFPGETFYSVSLARPAVDPQLERDNSALIFECTEPACINHKTYHEVFAGHPDDPDAIMHEHETITGDGYQVLVYCEQVDLDNPLVSEPWKVDVYASECYLAPSAVPSLVSDLSWAKASAEKLNRTHARLQVAA